MDKPYIVDFGEGEERWQDAELGKKWSTWIDQEVKNEEARKKANPSLTAFSRKYYEQLAAKEYRNELVHRYLDENPNTPEFEEQDDETTFDIEDLARKHFKLNQKDIFTPSQQNWMRAWRVSRDLADENEPLFASLDTRYNRATLEENKTWEEARAKIPAEEYKPMVIQSTSPSRLQSLGVFGQQIDPNVPMFLQKANPHIPWGVNHPLKKAVRAYNLTRRATPDREEYEYDALEKLNNPRYLEEDLYPKQDTTVEPWSHLKDTADEVKKFGYTPHLIDKMQTEKQKQLLDLYIKYPPNDE